MNTLHEYVANNDLLLMGVTGVGKTTFTRALSGHASVNYISLGEITRTAAAAPGGTHIRDLILGGGVWPLATITGLIEPHLKSTSSIVLDGVPKHYEEAEWLTQQLPLRPYPTTLVTLTASRDTVLGRLNTTSRLGRPETEEQVEDRIRVYDEKYQTIVGILGSCIAQSVEIDTTLIAPEVAVQEFARIVL